MTSRNNVSRSNSQRATRQRWKNVMDMRVKPKNSLALICLTRSTLYYTLENGKSLKNDIIILSPFFAFFLFILKNSVPNVFRFRLQLNTKSLLTSLSIIKNSARSIFGALYAKFSLTKMMIAQHAFTRTIFFFVWCGQHFNVIMNNFKEQIFHKEIVISEHFFFKTFKWNFLG